MSLSPEQSRIFEEYERMFMTEGWKMFVDDIKKNKEALTGMLLTQGSDQRVLDLCKGRDDVYRSVIGLQAYMEAARKQLEDE